MAERKPFVEVPIDRFERLLLLLERNAQAIERFVAQGEDEARRAEKRSGPTTAEAEADVAARLTRIRRR